MVSLLRKNKVLIKQLTKIEIKKTADEIYSFLISLDKTKYCDWHSCHKDFRQIKKTEEIKGSVFFLHEVVDGVEVKFKWTVIECKKNRLIKMKANSLYPIYLSLEMKQNNSKTIINQEISLGFENKIGKIIDFFISSTFFSKRVRKSQRLHAIEEYKKLENLL